MEFIHAEIHNPLKPVSMEREADDVVIIEGLRFSGDFFRSFKSELSGKVLYHIENVNGVQRYHVIHTLHDAVKFFAPDLLKE